MLMRSCPLTWAQHLSARAQCTPSTSQHRLNSRRTMLTTTRARSFSATSGSLLSRSARPWTLRQPETRHRHGHPGWPRQYPTVMPRRHTSTKRSRDDSTPSPSRSPRCASAPRQRPAPGVLITTDPEAWEAKLHTFLDTATDSGSHWWIVTNSPARTREHVPNAQVKHWNLLLHRALSLAVDTTADPLLRLSLMVGFYP